MLFCYQLLNDLPTINWIKYLANRKRNIGYFETRGTMTSNIELISPGSIVLNRLEKLYILYSLSINIPYTQ
jgi:hypothetical protein